MSVKFNPFVILINRPTATSMFFLALVMTGLFAWYRIPIELFPAMTGQQLHVQFRRPGSDPEIVEREILLPLEARAGDLAGLEETWGQIRGDNGNMTLMFEPDSNYRVRELELRRIAADLARSQPEGTFINVSAQDSTAVSRFVMTVQVLGSIDENSLRDLVDERIQARVASLPGISQVWVNGGAPREVTIWIDPDRCAALGIRAEQVTQRLGQSVRRLEYLGGTEQFDRRVEVILDGRPHGIVSLGNLRIDPARPVLLRHVADIEMTTARQESLFRVNGKAAVGLFVFQDEGANLVQLGRDLREKFDELKEEFNPYGIDFEIGFDAAETVENQLDRLKKLAIWGIVIALVVLYLFLRELRAVAVVAVAVPVSLLIAGAILYLGGYTLNLITLLGLVIGIGMLVDNSVVVFEAVQRSLERGLKPGSAAVSGIQRTVRAIITASITNAIVFIPLIYLIDDTFYRQMSKLFAVAILIPLFASLLVAIGLVPLLAHRLAAPAAASRLKRTEERRQFYGGRPPPQRTREIFSALLKVALRRPIPWLVGVTTAIILTFIIAVPWVLVDTLSQQSQQADQVRLQLDLSGGNSLDAASDIFNRAEQAVLELDGVELVESSIQEQGGTLTVHLEDTESETRLVSAGDVRNEVRQALNGIDNVEVKAVSMTGGNSGNSNSGSGGGGGGGAGPFGDAPSEVRVSGPNMIQLRQLAREIEDRLDAIPEVEDTWISVQEGQEELQVQTVPSALALYRLNPEQALNSLNILRREGVQMQVGFTLSDGRELPLTVRRPELVNSRAIDVIESLRLATQQGAIPLGVVTEGEKVLPPPTIAHHNGRRELTVNYTLGSDAPEVGPSRVRLEERIQNVIQNAYRPSGYTVEAVDSEQTSDLMKTILVPVLLLLFAVLAIAFESMTMPVLVMIAVPLTVLGATWALVLSGYGGDVYALIGVVALLGLTVNPAILLIDRMQRKLMASGCSGGTAAIASVKERTRPVLMTSFTTIAGLWPLALSTGDQFEIWPSFATVVMGGLFTSTLLTLLVIPVGFVFLSKLDRIFGRLGPWIVMGWVAATGAVIAPLILTQQLNSFNWQIVCTILVGAFFLWLAVLIFNRQPELTISGTSPAIETRYLSKIYGQPGLVMQAWREGVDFSKKFLVRSRSDCSERAVTFFLLLLATAYLAINLESLFWQLVFYFISAAFLSRIIIEIMNYFRGDGSTGALTDKKTARYQSLQKLILFIMPWLMLTGLFITYTLLPWLEDEPQRLLPAVVVILIILTLLVQLGRRTAVKLSDLNADIDSEDLEAGWLRKLWRNFSFKIFGFDLPKDQIEALDTVTFRAQQGMIGVLGPNGAGKTTMLRMLAGVLDPTLGTIHYHGFLKKDAGLYVNKWVGYLPQEFGLPDHLTAQEYLDYFALFYEVGDRTQCRQRVDQLLQEVGLGERKHEKISGYSGGMRQRVAVARTLLRQPPIIIVDEPTVGLDPRERIRFRNLLSRLAEGRVILFSTHVVEDVAVACERVIVMSQGRLNYDGKPSELAGLAQGKTWELRLSSDKSPQLSENSRVVDNVPEADGSVRMRIISESQPHPDARSIEPLIEDGYLYLVNR